MVNFRIANRPDTTKLGRVSLLGLVVPPSTTSLESPHGVYCEHPADGRGERSWSLSIFAIGCTCANGGALIHMFSLSALGQGLDRGDTQSTADSANELLKVHTPCLMAAL
jgi:hypothetical protein